MTQGEVERVIIGMIGRMLSERGVPVPEINGETRLVGGADVPMDSLDLAGMVVELDETTRRDPFKRGFVNFTTVGELAALYGTETRAD